MIKLKNINEDIRIHIKNNLEGGTIFVTPSGYSHVPDGFHVAHVYNGTYREYFTLNSGDSSDNYELIDLSCSYYLGHGLVVQNELQAQALFESGGVISDGGLRNRFLQSLQGGEPLTEDDFQWISEYENINEIRKRYLVESKYLI